MTEAQLRRLRVKAGIAKDKLYEIQAALAGVAPVGMAPSQLEVRVADALGAIGRLQDALDGQAER